MEHLKHPKIGAYRGSTRPSAHNRSIIACEQEWAKTTGYELKVDRLIVSQLELAEAQGRKSIDIVDVGSGDAGLFRGIVDFTNQTPLTRTFLAAKPDMRIKLTGLTDAKHDIMKDITTVKPPKNSPFEVSNTAFTLTANQRLRDFLAHKGIPQVDLIFATCSLQYLGFRTFEQTVRDSLEALRGPGSLMIVAVYSYLAPGILIDPDKNFTFTIPEPTPETKALPHPKNTLKFKGSRLATIPNHQTDEELRVLLTTLKKLNQAGGLDQPSFDGAVEKITEPSFLDTPGNHHIATVALNLAEQTLAKKVLERYKTRKTIILEQLQIDYQDQVKMDINTNGFTGFVANKI